MKKCFVCLIRDLMAGEKQNSIYSNFCFLQNLDLRFDYRYEFNFYIKIECNKHEYCPFLPTILILLCSL